jgi:hypothetical protein
MLNHDHGRFMSRRLVASLVASALGLRQPTRSQFRLYSINLLPPDRAWSFIPVFGIAGTFVTSQSAVDGKESLGWRTLIASRVRLLPVEVN